jgi:hypothetical protein
MTTTNGDNLETKNEQSLTGSQVIQALERLKDVLQSDENGSKSAPHLSHFRDLTGPVQTAYDLLQQGATLIHGTSTKYTLVGKVVAAEQAKLAFDLLRGCEIIGAATHVVLQDSSGCSRSVRHSMLRAALAIFVNVNNLVQTFEDGTALQQENVGAQKTGAVWQSCDYILNRMLPLGNRNAMRRELFRWTQDAQETLDEFQEVIDLGPSEENGRIATVEEDGDDDENFGEGSDQQYSELELPIAHACLALVKCSRGCMKVTLEACEALGVKAKETENDNLFDAISQLHDLARLAGVGVTDLGSAMYPPLSQSFPNVKEQIQKQSQAIIAVQDFILSLEGMPPSVTEFSQKLLLAAQSRQQEAIVSIDTALCN